MKILSGILTFVSGLFGSNKVVSTVVPVAVLVADAVEPRIEELLKGAGVNPEDVSTILTGIENIVTDELAAHGKTKAAAAVASK